MTHIELSLSPLAQQAAETDVTDPLTRWAAVVAAAEEACLVLDTRGVIVAASTSFSLLLRLGQRLELPGKRLSDRDVLFLIDFTAAGNELGETERGQIPPLLALSSGRLARGLMRIRRRDERRTLDAIATPLRHRDRVVGSLSFFAIV